MKRSFNTTRFFSVMALGSLAGAAVGALLSINRKDKNPAELATEVKDMARNLEKKAKRQARNLQKEEWVAKEKEKIENHLKH